MKKQKLAVVFAALLTMVGFSSCLNSEDDGIREWGGYFEVNNTYGSVNFVDPTGIQLVPNKTIIDAPATLLNVVGDSASAMMVTRVVEGKDWIKKKNNKKEK